MLGTIGTGPHIDVTIERIVASNDGGSADGGLGGAVSAAVTTTAVSATTRRIVRSTSRMSSPGRIRQFTVACTRCGSAFTACPPLIMVVMHVVRSIAL